MQLPSARGRCGQPGLGTGRCKRRIFLTWEESSSRGFENMSDEKTRWERMKNVPRRWRAAPGPSPPGAGRSDPRRRASDATPFYGTLEFRWTAWGIVPPADANIRPKTSARAIAISPQRTAGETSGGPAFEDGIGGRVNVCVGDREPNGSQAVPNGIAWKSAFAEAGAAVSCLGERSKTVRAAGKNFMADRGCLRWKAACAGRRDVLQEPDSTPDVS